MPLSKGGSRTLLRALRAVLSGADAHPSVVEVNGHQAPAPNGQDRLDQVVRLVASNMVAEVCSIYLKRDDNTLELCATEGLRKDAVHTSRLRVGQGLVGRIAQRAAPFATEDAQNAPGFRYLPETGEEIYKSFVGVPIQRLGEVMGVLVVQNRVSRQYNDEEIEALEIVAMVIAEMAEAGAFRGSDGIVSGPRRRSGPALCTGTAASDGIAEGTVHLHEPRLVVFNPIAEDVASEHGRLADALSMMRGDIDALVEGGGLGDAAKHRDIFEAYRMFAHDKGWTNRLREAIDGGLSAEVAVEKVQSSVRARMERVTDPYLRERLHDLDDLANRLLRYLVDPEQKGMELPADAILVARNIGPGELIDHADQIKAVVLEEGSLSSHAAIVARALNLPMVVQAERVTRDANAGDRMIVDGDGGRVHLRPESSVLDAFRAKIALMDQEREIYLGLRQRPARTLDGHTLRLRMNAGILADLPSLRQSGAEGVGLFRTELQFMIRGHLPGRDAQSSLYSRILDAAGDNEVVFRTLDIGSDKILPFMRREEEPNPALGWRAIRVGLDRPRLFRMQLQSLIRGAKGRSLSIMFPMVTEADEYHAAREMLMAEVERLAKLGYARPARLRLGAMLETPSLAFAPESFFRSVDFISVGGNDLMQFFFAADRENERVRRRYDMLNLSFLDMLSMVVDRCDAAGTSLSYCGEAAGRRVEALALAAIGFRELSMRPASIGPVKRMLLSADLAKARAAIEAARMGGASSARENLVQVLLDTVHAAQ
ncbi:MAG: phosphoenolpyruvate--protein phosphotransferase [Pseudomonadota bacterium]